MTNAESTAVFLCGGSDTAYYYGYEPESLMKAKTGSWGNQLMLLQRLGEETAVPVATFHAMRVLSGDWMDPKGGLHRASPVRKNLGRGEKDLLAAFALERPDASWSLLLIRARGRPARRRVARATSARR